jgi:hypothetical protein
MTARWTHTAVLTETVKVGPRQFYHWDSSNARPGTTVELYQDPALQDGDCISIMLNGYGGVARLASLTNIQAK